MKNRNKQLSYLATFFIYLACIVNIHAGTVKTKAPMDIPGTTRVSAEDIFTLVDKHNDLVIIDSRIRSDRTQGFLEGSISLPDVMTSCSSLKKVLPKKSTPVVFYCNGVKCGRSGKASRKAVKCGYTNIYWFRGGFEEWKSRELPYIKMTK